MTEMAAEQYTVTLLTLPAELLHRICDFLDAETIVLSFRHVCVQLFAVAETYNRYKVRFSSLSKMNICRIIPAENVVSLDFGNERSTIMWIELFLSISDIHQFTRLRSLSIRHINARDLKIILYYVAMNCKLTSFAIYSDILQISDDTWQLLSSLIAQSTLYNLSLNFDLSNKEKLSWPRQSTITNLSFGTCTVKQFSSILQNSPHLHTLVMNNCLMTEIDKTFLFKSHQQLNSLTLNDMQMTMDKLESFLSLLPSLIHLNLTSSGKPFEFVQRLSRWEKFVPVRLPRLSQFEFCIFCYCSDWENFDVLIDAFRTPFWLEEKRWFVTCQFRDDWTSSFTVFTSPEPSIQCYPEENRFDRITCSNSTITGHD
jgi:hypothetical protein